MIAQTQAMPRALGIILPSSNRIVERVARSVLEAFPHLDACFSRVPYSGHPPDGYDLAPFRQAAGMLAQARPDIILWNATRGALLGFEPDKRLCAMIEAETGIVATTTALATVELFRSRNISRIALLAQGDDGEGRRLQENFGRQGIEIAAVENLEITENFEAAGVSADRIEHHVARLVERADVEAALIWSTNLAGNRLIAPLGSRLGIEIFDSTTLGMMHALSVVDDQTLISRSQRAGS